MSDEIWDGDFLPAASSAGNDFFAEVEQAAGFALQVKPETYQSRINPAQAYILKLQSKQSRVVQKSTLNMISMSIWNQEWMHAPWHLLDRDQVLLLIATLSEQNYAPSTKNRYLSAMKAVAKEAWLGGTMGDRQYSGISEIDGAKGSRVRGKGRLIKNSEIQHLLHRKRPNTSNIKAIRDRAVVAIMLTSGLRKSEVCGLKTSNLNLDEGFFTVIGKGDKEALIHLSTEVQPLIADWIASKGEPTSHVFNAISRGGRVLDRPLSTSGMSYILDTVAKDTGVARFAPHDTRRTYATNMFAAGHDPLTVRDMMRHASVETTEIYNIKNDEKLKEVATTFRILAPE
jgi:integrase/recombinase XerD